MYIEVSKYDIFIDSILTVAEDETELIKLIAENFGSQDVCKLFDMKPLVETKTLTVRRIRILGIHRAIQKNPTKTTAE
ncbi:Hypothetical predicted protein [Octopus vulgaris]|uniref:Uncharacterized protein n=1 Tax=Octopus vulgaris TaxID=6645 RepID=A0AA36EZV0_OCTVU|nr:Hypothetical predicted protein [Octopus vulgaris]